MIAKKRCVAMLLAGGQGSRLQALTRKRAKPAVPFGGKYRIIDFPLSNCTNSGIDTVGVLTQYEPLELNAYIGTGASWDLNCMNSGAYVLPPYVKGKKGEWYAGTANAVYQNMNFINRYNPEYVLILSGDHIYKMDYEKMIYFHEKNRADGTIAVIEVALSEASRFGIMNTDDNSKILEFEEKPSKPKNNLASMGIYIFNWRKLSRYLIEDNQNPASEKDFGKNIIPTMLNNNEKLFAYKFDGYWRDVGTIESLWESNMELLSKEPSLNLEKNELKIYTRNYSNPPHYIAKSAVVKNSIVADGCYIEGKINNCIIHSGVKICKDAVITDSIIMSNSTIESGCIIKKSIVDEECFIKCNTLIGGNFDITVIGANTLIKSNEVIEEGAMIEPDSIIGIKLGGLLCQGAYLESFVREEKLTNNRLYASRANLLS